MNSRNARTLVAVFTKPTRADITWNELVALLTALGFEADEGCAGSRVSFRLGGEKLGLHKPHPQRVLHKYQVEQVRAFLDAIGVRPPG